MDSKVSVGAFFVKCTETLTEEVIYVHSSTCQSTQFKIYHTYFDEHWYCRVLPKAGS